MDWKVADAKNRFSELISRALDEGPQRVVRRDRAVMVVSQREYDRLKGKGRDFKKFLLSAPRLDRLDLARDRSPIRNAGL
ncbi:MAG: type II toxin-antitoxin system prevent-host-death family antitoxin [Thermodesulfobacteriota bacterium]